MSVYPRGTLPGERRKEMKKENETADKKQDRELDEKELETIAGGVRTTGGDDDLEDLEVER